MIIFLSGGCKNGKSTIAENCAVRLARQGEAVLSHLYYIATMIPHDDEDLVRIERHKASRSGKGFTTIECGERVVKLIETADPDGTYLLDSVTAVLSNEMFRTDDDINFYFDETAGERVASELIEFSKHVRNIIFVSDYIFSDLPSSMGETEKYRQGLAYVDKALCKVADTVGEVLAGNIYLYKGEMPV